MGRLARRSVLAQAQEVLPDHIGEMLQGMNGRMTSAGPSSSRSAILLPMHWLVGIPLILLTGSIESLDDVQRTDPVRSESYAMPAKALAECVMRGIDDASWPFGHPGVQSSADSPTLHVYAISSNSILFDVAFAPLSSETLVTYRRGHNGHGTEEQTWAIIERCSQPVSAPAHDADRLPQSGSLKP